MKFSFCKMHGCANDYLFAREEDLQGHDPAETSRKLSHRRRGVGSDGLVTLGRSDKADLRMRIFNADGSEAEMCGNAIRCAADLFLKGTEKTACTVETKAGIKTVRRAEGGYTVDMGAPILEPNQIPVGAEGCPVLRQAAALPRGIIRYSAVSMGNPHAVILREDMAGYEEDALFADFRAAGLYPKDVNIEIVDRIDERRIRVAVSERGSGRTAACGTGACAAAVASKLLGVTAGAGPIEVELPGGTLLIEVTEKTVYMTGPVAYVFSGEAEL